MKKKKGFTLVEILAVLAIMALIMVLVVPVAIGIINDTKDEAYNIQLKNIETAARGYVAEYSSTIPELQPVGGYYTITLNDLVEDGLIDAPIKNPKTNVNFDLTTTTVLITKISGGNFTYEITAN